MASPLRRTIQTAVIGLAPTLQRRPEVPFLLVPQAQEISDRPCDTGTDPMELKVALGEIFGEGKGEDGFEAGRRIDFGGLGEGWNGKVSEDECLCFVFCGIERC